MTARPATAPQMPGWALRCHRCGWSGGLDSLQACPACRATLLATADRATLSARWDDGARGLWRYRAWLPVPADAEPVTLGEGATALVAAPRLEPDGDVLLKLETCNPTLAFKDRPVSVAATVARAQGAAGLLCASTGNTAVSVAAYGARAGMPTVCVVPAGTPPVKLNLATGSGAHLLEIDGTYSDAHALARAAAARSGWANLTTTYLNPYMLEGDKTLGLELFEQLGGTAPAAVVVPVGAGPLLAGIGKAFDELRATGRIERTPRLFAAQAAGCAPIARAFTEGGAVRPWRSPAATTAGAIADPLVGYPEDGERTATAVRASGGTALALDDEAIHAAAAALAHCEGISVEPAAAAAAAAYRHLRHEGVLTAHDRTVVVLTGHGSKDPAHVGAPHAPLGVVAPGDLAGAEQLLEEALRA